MIRKENLVKTIIFLLVCMGLSASFIFEAHASTAILKEVRVAPAILYPGENQTVAINYLMDEPGMTEISFFCQDFGLVRKIVRKKSPRGVNTVSWDGRDRNGEVLPDGPYFFTISAKLADGSEQIYDPTLFSGGEKLDLSVYPEDYDPETGIITYYLPQQARVRIRAGLHNGPLYSTIVDWESQASGKHQVLWDGWSDDKMVRVSGQKEMVITIQAFSLPENSIIIKGTGRDYYGKKEQGRRTAMASQESRLRLSHSYLIRKRMERSPVFEIKINGQVPTPPETISVSDNINLMIEADEATRLALSQNRFELVIFVDDQRWDEVEYGYVPLTYVMDTKQMKPGEHLITVSLVTLTDQRASRSARINVENSDL